MIFRHSLLKPYQPFATQCVADVVEAVIGAAFLSGGSEAGLRVSKNIGIQLPLIDRWADFGRKALAPSPEFSSELKDGSLEMIEGRIGRKVKRPHILAQALVSIYLSPQAAPPSDPISHFRPIRPSLETSCLAMRGLSSLGTQF